MPPKLKICAVENCDAKNTKNPELSFHEIPTDPAIEGEWLNSIFNNDLDKILNWEPTSSKNFVCSRHFVESCFSVDDDEVKILLPGALPTIFDEFAEPSKDNATFDDSATDDENHGGNNGDGDDNDDGGLNEEELEELEANAGLEEDEEMLTETMVQKPKARRGGHGGGGRKRKKRRNSSGSGEGDSDSDFVVDLCDDDSEDAEFYPSKKEAERVRKQAAARARHQARLGSNSTDYSSYLTPSSSSHSNSTNNSSDPYRRIAVKSTSKPQTPSVASAPTTTTPRIMSSTSTNSSTLKSSPAPRPGPGRPPGGSGYSGGGFSTSTLAATKTKPQKSAFTGKRKDIFSDSDSDSDLEVLDVIGRRAQQQAKVPTPAQVYVPRQVVSKPPPVPVAVPKPRAYNRKKPEPAVRPPPVPLASTPKVNRRPIIESSDSSDDEIVFPIKKVDETKCPYVGLKCIICLSYSHTKLDLAKHIRFRHRVHWKSCELCKKEFEGLDLGPEPPELPPEPPKPVVEKVSKKDKLKNGRPRKQHYDDFHDANDEIVELKENLEEDPNEDEFLGNKTWDCKDCDQKFKKFTLLDDHFWDKHFEIKFCCDICSEVFTSPEDLFGHKSDHFGSADDITKHQDSTAEEILCQLCGEPFWYHDLESHLDWHGENPNYFIQLVAKDNYSNQKMKLQKYNRECAEREERERERKEREAAAKEKEQSMVSSNALQVQIKPSGRGGRGGGGGRGRGGRGGGGRKPNNYQPPQQEESFPTPRLTLHQPNQQPTYVKGPSCPSLDEEPEYTNNQRAVIQTISSQMQTSIFGNPNPLFNLQAAQPTPIMQPKPKKPRKPRTPKQKIIQQHHYESDSPSPSPPPKFNFEGSSSSPQFLNNNQSGGQRFSSNNQASSSGGGQSAAPSELQQQWLQIPPAAHQQQPITYNAPIQAHSNSNVNQFIQLQSQPQQIQIQTQPYNMVSSVRSSSSSSHQSSQGQGMSSSNNIQQIIQPAVQIKVPQIIQQAAAAANSSSFIQDQYAFLQYQYQQFQQQSTNSIGGGSSGGGGGGGSSSSNNSNLERQQSHQSQRQVQENNSRQQGEYIYPYNYQDQMRR